MEEIIAEGMLLSIEFNDYDALVFQSYYSSPLGILAITSNGKSITHIQRVTKAGKDTSDAMTKTCIKELREYFAGERKKFDIPLDPTGTKFQKTVWRKMQRIPYGSSLSYGTLAKGIGKPKSSRAVGSACGKNPLLVAIPCHRVIASNGTLGGFSAGLPNKLILRNLEERAV